MNLKDFFNEGLIDLVCVDAKTGKEFKVSEIKQVDDNVFDIIVPDVKYKNKLLKSITIEGRVKIEKDSGLAMLLSKLDRISELLNELEEIKKDLSEGGIKFNGDDILHEQR